MLSRATFCILVLSHITTTPLSDSLSILRAGLCGRSRHDRAAVRLPLTEIFSCLVPRFCGVENCFYYATPEIDF